MGATKKHFYSKSQLQLSEMYKALEHPARIYLIEYLLKHQGVNVTEITNSIQLSKPTVSAHLRLMHQAGIVGYEVIQNNCCYKINPKAMDLLSEYLFTIENKSSELGQRDYCRSIV